MKTQLKNIYRRLYKNFGPQGWWPGDTPFEVIAGAILTQNTNWENVSRAITNLKKAKVLNARKIHNLPVSQLAGLIKPAGYYNIKARRVKNFLDYLFATHKGNLRNLAAKSIACLRKELLEVNGIGEETADSIILYAFNKPIFVVDAYTKRILSRHRLISKYAAYAQVQKLFMDNLEPHARLFNEYHALLVRLGKDFCRKNNPRCQPCPLNNKTSSRRASATAS